MARRNDSLSESLNCARPTEVAVQQCTAGGARSGSQGRPAELGGAPGSCGLDSEQALLHCESFPSIFEGIRR